MPWHRFKAGPEEIRQVLSFVTGKQICILFETYGEHVATRAVVLTLGGVG